MAYNGYGKIFENVMPLIFLIHESLGTRELGITHSNNACYQLYRGRFPLQTRSPIPRYDSCHFVCTLLSFEPSLTQCCLCFELESHLSKLGFSPISELMLLKVYLHRHCIVIQAHNRKLGMCECRTSIRLVYKRRPKSSTNLNKECNQNKKKH